MTYEIRHVVLPIMQGECCEVPTRCKFTQQSFWQNPTSVESRQGSLINRPKVSVLHVHVGKGGELPICPMVKPSILLTAHTDSLADRVLES